MAPQLKRSFKLFPFTLVYLCPIFFSKDAFISYVHCKTGGAINCFIGWLILKGVIANIQLSRTSLQEFLPQEVLVVKK